MTDKPFFTPSEAAAIAGCTAETIRRACDDGSLTAVKHGTNWMIRPANLRWWVNNRPLFDGRIQKKRKRLIAKTWAKVAR